MRQQGEVDAAALTASRQPTGFRSGAREALSPEAANHQVVVGDIPAEPPGFRLRAGLLADLDDQAGARVSVIHAGTGRHGVGATQLAAAFARAKLEAGWRLVAWVNGADTGSLLAGLAAVADAAGLTGVDSGPGDSAAAVRDWLATNGDRCLLVFDNVSDPEALRAFVPAGGTARVLITSARQPSADLGSAIPVGVFSAAEATAYLARRTGLEDEAGAAEVAAVLEHLPLSLALAAPVIAGQQVGYAGYLDRLRATPAELSLTGDDGQPYPPSSTRAARLSVQAVRAADRTGMCFRVMEILAVLSAAGVRRELLYAAGQAGVLASGRHRAAADPVDRVLDWLSRRSLLTFSRDGQTVILHGLVAQVLRNELERADTLTAACETAAFVLDVYSRALTRSGDRRAIRGFPQQVTALLDRLAGPVTEVDDELTWLLLRLRFVAFYHLLELGDSTPQAIAVGEPLAADLERSLGPGHPDTMNSRNSLAAAYLAAGRVAEAIPLFEQILDVRQHMLGHDHPDTLTSQNNLAAAFQDAGQVDEAIQLYQLNLERRERLLGPDHPGTLISRGNLATAYLDAGRVDEAIPLLEQTLAGRERKLGPDHPDTQTALKNLARAYRDTGRDADAIPRARQSPPVRKRQPPDGAAGRVPRAGVPQRPVDPARRVPRARVPHPPAAPAAPAGQPSRVDVPRPPAAPAGKPSRVGVPRPPAAPAGQAPRASVRRPPAAPAGQVLPAGIRRPPADPAWRARPDSIARPAAKPTGHPASRTQKPPEDTHYDRDLVAAIAAGDPAGMAQAYDRYAAALYGYCHWKLQDPAAAAAALTDTFVIAAVTLGNLSDPSSLRPRLFALARNECQRRMRRTSAGRAEQADAADQQVDVMDLPAEALSEPSDATIQFRAFSESSDAAMQFRAVSESSDATMQFRAVSEPSDATIQFRMIGQFPDATVPFRVLSRPVGARNGPPHLNNEQGQAELRTLVYSILAGLKPRDREVIELSFRHDVHGHDLAIALGVSPNRAQALASRAGSQLEETLGVLHIALTRREACPALGELLADWDGQPTERMHDLVSGHIEDCQTCALHGWGSLRPAAFSRLLPLAPLSPELREQVLRMCTSTTQDAVAYRQRAARHAERIWGAKFSHAISQVSWNSVRDNPGVAVATVAIALWVLAAVSASLLIFLGARSAGAQSAQTPAGTSSSSPAATSAQP